MDERKYSVDYKVRISDSDAQARLKLPSLFELLQEAATEHAQKLGVDYTALKPLGLGWIISKMAIRLEELPKWNERVYLETWASNRDRITTCREFVARNAAGKTLFSARSQWAIFDISTRRLARLEKIKPWANIADEFANDDVLEPHLERPADPDAAQNSESVSAPCQIRKTDIDLNGHVNNSVYITLALQALDEKFVETRRPAHIKISFLDEIKPDDAVESIAQTSGDRTLHSIVNRDTRRECARLNICWQ